MDVFDLGKGQKSVLILIFLENALRPQEQLGLTINKPLS